MLNHSSKFIASFIFLLTFWGQCSFAITLEELKSPKSPAYRLGTTDVIEKEYKVVDLTMQNATKKASYEKEYFKNITYSDTTLKELSKEVSKLLDIDREEMLEDVQILWYGAATKSETIKFALYKLANPEADKPNEGIVKKIVRPIASVSGMAGAGLMNPIAAASAMMGSSLFNSLTYDDKDLNYKFSKITDADMIVLIRKVDDLQKRMIREYYDYMSAQAVLKMANESLKNRARNFEAAKHMNRETLVIADAYYRTALDNKAQLELDFLAKRAALEQLVGPQALQEFEKKLIERQSVK